MLFDLVFWIKITVKENAHVHDTAGQRDIRIDRHRVSTGWLQTHNLATYEAFHGSTISRFHLSGCLSKSKRMSCKTSVFREETSCYKRVVQLSNMGLSQSLSSKSTVYQSLSLLLEHLQVASVVMPLSKEAISPPWLAVSSHSTAMTCASLDIFCVHTWWWSSVLPRRLPSTCMFRAKSSQRTLAAISPVTAQYNTKLHKYYNHRQKSG